MHGCDFLYSFVKF